MLCKVTLKNHQSTGSTHNAFLRSIQQIATAAAGSTPSCVVTKQGSGTSTYTYDTITVIDNTTAGGWTVNSAGSNMPTEADNAILGSNDYPYVTLYTNSGKSGSYDTAFITFSSSEDHDDSITNYQRNIGVMWGIGTVAQSNPSETSTYWNKDNIFNQTHAPLMRKGAIPYTTQDSTPTPSMFNLMNGNGGAADDNQSIFYVSATSEWIIIAREGYVSNAQENNLTSTLPSGGFFYWGMRENQVWEDGYDYPYWACVYKIHASRAQTTTGGYWAWMARKNYSGSVDTVGLYNQFITKGDTGTYDFCPVTYQANSSSQQNKYYKSGYYGNNLKYDASKVTSTIYRHNPGTTTWVSGDGRRSGLSLVEPLMGTVHEDWSASDVAITNPVADVTTGSWLPPAIPIVISATQGENAGGKLKGMYHGMQIKNWQDLNSVRVPEGLYNIDGQYFMPFSYGYFGSTTSASYGQNISWISV